MRVLNVVTALMAVCSSSGQQESVFLSDYHRAWALVHQLRPKEGIPVLDALIQRRPDFYPAYRTMAVAYLYNNDLSAGRRHFERLLARSADYGLAYYGLAMLSDHTGHEAQAHKEMAACVDLLYPRPEVFACYLSFDLKQRFTRPVPIARRPGDGLYFDLVQSDLLLTKRDFSGVRLTASRGLNRAREIGHKGAEAFLLYVLADSFEQKPESRIDLMKQAASVAEAVGDKDWHLRANTVINSCIRQLGRLVDAGSAMKENQSKAERWGSPIWAGHFLRQRADLAEDQGDLQESLRLNSQAKEQLRRYPPTSSYYEAFHHSGDAYKRQGLVAEAQNEYEQMLDLARKSKNRMMEGYALRYLGDFEAERGLFFQALDNHTRSFKIFEDYGRVSGIAKNVSGASLTRIGKLHAALGDLAAAETFYRRAQKMATESKDSDPLRRVHIELSNLYLRMGLPAKALRELATANQSASIRNPNFEPATLLNTARAQRQLNRHETALRTLDLALEAAGRTGNQSEQAEALTEIGVTNLAAGRIPAAEFSLGKGVALAHKLGSLRLIVPARLAMADLEARRHRPSARLEHLKEAIRALEDIRNRTPGTNFRAGLQQQFWQAYDQMGELLAESGRHAESFALAEQSRARSFLDILIEGGARMSKGLSDKDRKRHHKLASAISQASAAVLKQETELNRRAVVLAEQELRRWVSERYRTNPQFSNLQYPRSLSLSQAQSSLPDNETVLLEFALGERQSRVWAVRQKDSVMVKLPSRADVDEAIRAFRGTISRPPSSEADLEAYRQASRGLYELLLRPIEDRLRGMARVLIVPDGMLHYLPFEVLMKDHEPLVASHDIVYAPSMSVYAHLQSTLAARKPDKDRGELVAFGDPQYGAETNQVRSVLERSGTRLGRLPFTRTEVENLAALFPEDQRKVHLGEQATERALKDAPLRRYRRVHLAAHAIVDERLPIRSGILLAPGSPKEDGLLTMTEIFDLDLDADLVVLSACQTGLGQLVRGEGMVGLTRAIFHAGSPRVAVSLWEVHDLATSRFMDFLYRGLRRGETPAHALRQAKLAFLKGDSPAMRHPYYWAPFVLTGVF